ncbi:hypothetical protein OURE66S_03860 [Oligella ureolytica]
MLEQRSQNRIEPAEELNKSTAAEQTPDASEVKTPEKEVSPFKGELLDHGKAPYKFDNKKSMSYFVYLKDENGVNREHWGKG